MKKITLKLTKLQQELLLMHLYENICSGSCFMYKHTGHFPRYSCDAKCPKYLAHGDLLRQVQEQVEIREKW